VVLDLDRGTRTPITAGGGDDFDPRFTADGKRVIYESEHPVFDLYSRAIDASTAAEPLWVSAFDKMPGGITPDGKTLLATYNLVPYRQLWSVPLDGAGKPRMVLASSDGSLNTPAVSPDGHWLAFSSNASGRWEVYLSPWPGVSTGRTQVSVNGGIEPHWTRAGRELVFRNQDTILAVTVDPVRGATARPSELFHGNFEVNDQVLNYDVTPDGSNFLMVALPPGSEPRQVVVIANWFTELRRLMANAKAGP